MYCMTMTYPVSEGSVFDNEYYLGTHLPLCVAAFESHGFLGKVVRHAPSAVLSGDYTQNHLSVDLVFESDEALKQALKEEGADITADARNFTNVTPLLSFSEIDADVRH